MLDMDFDQCYKCEASGDSDVKQKRGFLPKILTGRYLWCQEQLELLLIPGLSSSSKQRAQQGRLLRKPRAPRKLPPIAVPEQDSKQHGEMGGHGEGRNIFADCFDMFDMNDEEASHFSPLPSGAPSLASPPPSESVPARATYPFRSPVSNVTSFVSRDDEKYVLDPMFRGRTSLGTYVDGKSLVKPFKPRGPDPLPPRAPKQNPEIFLDYDCDDIRFFKPPAFTLEHFVAEVADHSRMPMTRVRQIMYSKHNVKKLTKLLAEELHRNPDPKINTINFDPEEKNVPLCEPRIPQHQLLLEMAAMIKMHVRHHMQTDVRTVIKPAPKYSPYYHGGDTVSVPHTEIILYEDDAEEQETQAALALQETEAPGTDTVIHSARSRYFQDAVRERSRSPFAPPDEGSISPSELAILDSLIAGGVALSLKAHFIDVLPDITPLSRTIVYLNLSFNDFMYLPMEILDLWQLEVLKLRDNPLVELPSDINRLINLRVLVVSYCLLTTLPPGLFTLESLCHLSVAYNKLTFIPDEIKYLKKLEELDLDGNQLPALPAGVLNLRLTAIRVRNNFMHPLFWKDHTKKQPQRLLDMAMLELHQNGLPKDTSKLPDIVQRMLRAQEVCDCCKGPRYGEGLRMIRPVPRLFGVKHLPIMFQSCSPHCHQLFRTMGGNQLSEVLYGAAESG
ncbi:hypothetical protein BaRGS_00028291 [Batillaria attramentaria]|uniref:Leucine-rich repeat-containing protein 63 n=1 Tax=Batillaria attramentaria TaxID=370345 RepID=A0ABD0K058_9CAEN